MSRNDDRQKPTDEELVLAFQRGEERAFDELVRRYQQKIRFFCRHYMAESADADDAAQEIFIKIYQNLATFFPRARFSTWLFRVAINHCLNLVRARRRRQWLQPFSRVSETALQANTGKNDPSTDLERQERRVKVRAALAKLADDQRTAILLHRYEGLSYKEIAEVMKCSVASVEAKLHRAKLKLAELLAEYNVKD